MDLRRFEFDGRMEEKGGQQFVSGRGYYGDGFTRVHRIEPHGLMTNPPKGAKGVVLSPHPDMAFVLGLESPSHRPSGLPAGATALYDASGNIIKLIGDGVVMDFGSRTITMTGGNWNLTGNVSITGNLEVAGNIHATGSIIDEGGNTNHHGH